MNKKGFSIFEIMIVLGLGSVVSIALMSLISDMHTGTMKSSVGFVLAEQSNRIKTMLLDKQTFVNTYSAPENPAMNCLGQPVSCNSIADCAGKIQCSPTFRKTAYDSTLSRVALYNNATLPAGKAIFLDGRSTNDGGFNIKGAKCTGFSYNPPGNDNCPIGYLVNWFIDSSSSTSGVMVTITAKMIFNGSPDNPMNKFFNTNIDVLGKYDVQFKQKVDSLYNLVETNCIEAGISVAPGSTYPFYKSSVEVFPKFCVAETRLCRIDPDGVARLTGTATNASCQQDCHGVWGPCDSPCGMPGQQVFSVVIPQNKWGTTGNCTVPHGTPQACVGSCP